MADNKKQKLYQSALRYHREPVAGKLAVVATKPLATPRDLSLAYSPGVAAACEAIAEDEQQAAYLTARGNLVAVITNGTAVLGLGPIGALAAKPVMEGKAVLFKKFAHLDCIDIEVDERDPEEFCDVVASLEPSFGGINLEDIKAPDCFVIEAALRERMNIPVFHDDQHGTAIVTAAAMYNALKIVGKKMEDIKIVASGGGAASIACLNIMLSMGLKKKNIWLSDSNGLVYEGREEGMNEYKAAFARKTNKRSLEEVIDGADVFLGLSAPRVLTQDMVKKMGDQPIILALANPEPEILPELAKEAREDALIATGRSDYPNQVNNVLCFPFIFRGALDCGATTINEEMKVACVKAIANLAEAGVPDIVAKAYPEEELSFGPNYLIPKPFDPRLMVEVAPAVAKAAMESGVATRPIENFDEYREKLTGFVFLSGNLMQPVFERIRRDRKRIALAEGEDERVLRAAQALMDDGLADPILIGRPSVIRRRLERWGLQLDLDAIEVVNPESDPRYDDYWRHYHSIMERKGVSPDAARTIVRTNTTVIAALMVDRGEADAMVCGTYGRHDFHVRHVTDVIRLRENLHEPHALSVLVMPEGTFFICDSFVSLDPTAEQIAEMTCLAAEEVRRFGVEPKVALLSHSNFGTSAAESAEKMRRAFELIRDMNPELEVEGEMQGDAAIDHELRARLFPKSGLKGSANLLIMPNLDAANIAYQLLKKLGNGLPIGPLLLGTRKPAHIVTPAITARGMLNISALAAIDAIERGLPQFDLALDQ